MASPTPFRRMTHSFWSILMVSLAVLGTDSCWAQTELYVSPNGSDQNSGTRQQPFATLVKAQQVVRNRPDKVTVFLRAGTYYLSKPIVFGPADARKPDAAVTYRPYQQEKVRISGGVPLKLTWQKGQHGVYQANVAMTVVFDQLFVDGHLQRMARYPNYDPAAKFFGGTAADAISPQRASRWKNPVGGYVHALHKNEWGDFHYRITGKDRNGELQLVGGYQNNRRMGMHAKHRFVENIAEELDTLNEWYFDKASHTLLFIPPPGIDLAKAVIETPQIPHLFEFRGSEKTPVTNIALVGFELTQTLRTFMDNKEPLLRSDWTTYRGGAVVMEGAEQCRIADCYVNTVGGNAIYFSYYNRNNEVSGCRIVKAGASGVSFVGDPNAVRSPSFEYNEFVSLTSLDRTPGPKTNNFPAQCRVYNTLMHDLGQIEKQSAGVQISMAQDITVSHNTLYDLPRAGINMSEGTWGGHMIEFNDVFNTVLESGDHGSFNAWGRDRYWHPNKKTLDSIVATQRELVLLDVVKPITIRNNRFRCDHGWDIDLDDGSSNYHIYNNLCLNGGIKLREGGFRTVENNIMINNSFHPHVWFANSDDIFRKNIVSKPYYPIRVNGWGKEVDYTLFPDQKALDKARKDGTDTHSLAGDPLFKDPATGNYQVRDGSPALTLGFVNFPMDDFGVVSPALRALAKHIPLPVPQQIATNVAGKEMNWLGGKLRNVSGLGDRSAFGLPDEKGIILDDFAPGSVLAKSALKKNDVIRKLNYKDVATVTDLSDIYQEISWTGHATIEVIRNQRTLQFDLSFR